MLKKIQELIFPLSPVEGIPALKTDIPSRREFVSFSQAYRIGITCLLTDPESQKIIEEYKRDLDRLGYECEVLMFVDKKDKTQTVFLPSFSWEDINRKTRLPDSPRTERFMLKKFDLLFNLYLNPVDPLLIVSQHAAARCRVAPFLPPFKSGSDVFIPVDQKDGLKDLIRKINNTLVLKPYERRPV